MKIEREIDGEITEVIGFSDAMKILGVTEHTFYRAVNLPSVRKIPVTYRTFLYVLADVVAALDYLKKEKEIERPHSGWMTSRELADDAKVHISTVLDWHIGRYKKVPRIVTEIFKGKLFYEPQSSMLAVAHYNKHVRGTGTQARKRKNLQKAPNVLNKWNSLPWGLATKRHHYEANHEN